MLEEHDVPTTLGQSSQLNQQSEVDDKSSCYMKETKCRVCGPNLARCAKSASVEGSFGNFPATVN